MNQYRQTSQQRQFSLPKAKKWQIIFLSLGLLALVLQLICSRMPHQTEWWYSNGVFPYISHGLRQGFSFSPIPSYYLFMLALGLIFFRGARYLIRHRKKSNSWSYYIEFLYGFFAWLGFFLFYFYMAWGLNYFRIPVHEKMSINLTQALSEQMIKTNLDRLTRRLENIRVIYRAQVSTEMELSLWSPQLQSEIYALSKNAFTEMGYQVPAPLSHRELKPAGVLLHWGTSGFYFPLGAEPNLDAGLHALQKPFVLAHELGHALGIGGEGACNFIAYMACQRSDKAYIRYAGVLGFWRYLAGAYRDINPTGFNLFWENIPAGIRTDVEAIRTQMDKFPDFMPALRDATYQTYLKYNGIEDGLDNYSSVIELVAAYEQW